MAEPEHGERCPIHRDYRARRRPDVPKVPYEIPGVSCACWRIWARNQRERWASIGVARSATPTRNRRGSA